MSVVSADANVLITNNDNEQPIALLVDHVSLRPIALAETFRAPNKNLVEEGLTGPPIYRLLTVAVIAWLKLTAGNGRVLNYLLYWNEKLNPPTRRTMDGCVLVIAGPTPFHVGPRKG